MTRKRPLSNGPYLLSPAADAITIAWEMSEELDAIVRCGTETLCCTAAAKRQCVSREIQRWLYTVRLTALTEGTVYRYAVCVGEERLYEGSFRTLAAAPERLHLVTVSDTQLFHLSDRFAAMVAQEQPDFILHGGDISFGTGYQHEQYEANWFQRIPEVLAAAPVFYARGNHDDGPFFETLFLRPQAKYLNAAPDGHSFSMDYGIAHIVMVDSTPWGLFEMNAENAGGTLDAENRQRIRETLAWVEADLMSAPSQKARWRILMMHHPYTDVFNNRHIVPIAERCGVDLVLGGHLHRYVKAVSVNPDIGARTVYVMQGSLQDPAEGYDEGVPECRLLEEFPEVVAMGRNNYGILDISADALDCRFFGFRPDGSRTLVDTVHLEHGELQFVFENIHLRRLDNDGHVEIRADASNTGTVLAAVVMELSDNGCKKKLNLFGEPRQSRIVLLAPGEQRNVSAVYQARTPGAHRIECGDAEEEIFVFEPKELSFSHMRIVPLQGDKADCIYAAIEAVNNLDREIYTTVPLYIDQRIAATQSCFFRAHERRLLRFCHSFRRGGSYQISIADQLPEEICIEGSIRIIPRVLDKSGNGHYALLQGSPKLVEVNGQREVRLESYGDYIEIPPFPGLVAPQGFTGIVRACVDRLAHEDEMGHNPLMMRGISVGWGAAYMLRMVVDRSGSLKWGTCYDVTEYQWQGGAANVGTWADYAISFDKRHGGTSYCDGTVAAHVPGIPAKAEIRQWEDQPIFIGYSHIGHVIPELGKPKYFTHLPGRVAHVRFYRKGLTGESLRAVLDAPEEKGPDHGHLAVWLDFRHILTVGTHTTEWRHPAIYDPDFKTQKKYWRFCQLRAKTKLPPQAALRANVEVSDDKLSVKAYMKIVLKDGTNYIELSQLPEAQYLRIVTDFSASVGERGTFVPVLYEYQITAENEVDSADMLWATRPDWERGTFSGAVGFAPVDRLRDYPAYTDIIHG